MAPRPSTLYMPCLLRGQELRAHPGPAQYAHGAPASDGTLVPLVLTDGAIEVSRQPASMVIWRQCRGGPPVAARRGHPQGVRLRDENVDEKWERILQQHSRHGAFGGGIFWAISLLCGLLCPT